MNTVCCTNVYSTDKHDKILIKVSLTLCLNEWLSKLQDLANSIDICLMTWHILETNFKHCSQCNVKN